MNKGDLIGYENLDGDVEWGIVTSDEPFIHRPSAYDEEYMAVTVCWPDDKMSKTSERLEMILSDAQEDSGIWLQSSSQAR